MTRSKRMKPVARIAETHERNAARDLGQCREYLRHQDQRLRELIEYREEYARRFDARCGDGLDSLRAQDYRVFLERLTAAIEQQREVVAQALAECERRERQWQQRRTHAQAVGKLIDRYQDQEAQGERRREQREADDRAQRGTKPRLPD